MDTPKIRLSKEEEALINRADWILTKNNILQKVKQLFSNLQSRQHLVLQGILNLQPEIVNSPPKISKGENYKGLPWLVLDYPRLFEKESFCAIRTLFWWGNFFSSTLHLSGKYKNACRQKIIGLFENLQQKKFSICINTDQWEHHFDEDNYKAIEGMGLVEFEEVTGRHSFIKLAKKVPLDQWNDAEIKLAEIFSHLAHILEISFPSDETSLLPGGPTKAFGL